MPSAGTDPGEAKPVEESPVDAAERAAGKATEAAESLAVDAVAEIARISREAQAAVFDDARAAFSTLERLTHADNLADAATIQIDFVSARARANVERARAVVSYLGRAIVGRRAAPEPNGSGGAGAL